MTDKQAINDKVGVQESSSVSGASLSCSVWKNMELKTQPNNAASTGAGDLVMTDPYKSEKALQKNGLDASSELKKSDEKQGAQKDFKDFEIGEKQDKAPLPQPGDSDAVPGKSTEPKYLDHGYGPGILDKSPIEHFKHDPGIVEQAVPGQRDFDPGIIDKSAPTQSKFAPDNFAHKLMPTEK